MKTRWFLAAFAVVALVLAGGVSYLADASPDGLDTVTRRGCDVAQTASGERLAGSCMATKAEEHPLADSTFAGYAVGGESGLTGIAGIVGVAATAVLTGGLCWVLRHRHRSSGR